jgi:hypothetical protein
LYLTGTRPEESLKIRYKKMLPIRSRSSTTPTSETYSMLEAGRARLATVPGVTLDWQAGVMHLRTEVLNTMLHMARVIYTYHVPYCTLQHPIWCTLPDLTLSFCTLLCLTVTCCALLHLTAPHYTLPYLTVPYCTLLCPTYCALLYITVP